MADDRTEIRQVNWNELFGFTQIFRSFKLAIHPSKLLLAVAAIVLIYLAGQGMDLIWGWADAKAGPNEIQTYIDSPKIFPELVANWKEGRLENAVSRLKGVQSRGLNLVSPNIGTFSVAFSEEVSKRSYSPLFPDTGKLSKEGVHAVLSAVCREQDKQASETGAILDDVYQATAKRINDLGKDVNEGETKKQALKQLDKDYADARLKLTNLKERDQEVLGQIAGEGIFDAFGRFESAGLYNAIAAVGNGNILGNWVPYREAATSLSPRPPGGFLFYVIQALGGVKWLLAQHALFAVIFLAVALALWGLLGGAMHRIAALHAAREEKISVAQALRFALGKWPSFFTAPLLPLVVIFVLGLLIWLGGLLANTSYAVPLVGILFFVAIALGLVIAFVMVGLLGGFGLMYPTIAVEGSDSFDAISRSFAYIYARPWCAALYGAVALVYGAACYLFVRFFAYLALQATYTFLSWAVWTGGQSLGEDNRIPVIWRQPSWDSLYGNFHWAAMNGFEKVGAAFIWVWVALVAAVVGGFILSYCASSSTIIYGLLRRKVDATDLDDVYVQESSDLPAQTPAETAPGTDAPAAAPATEPPPAAAPEIKPSEENQPPTNP